MLQGVKTFWISYVQSLNQAVKSWTTESLLQRRGVKVITDPRREKIYYTDLWQGYMTFDVYEHPQIPGCDPRVTIDNHTKKHASSWRLSAKKQKNNNQEPHTALEGIIRHNQKLHRRRTEH